MEPWHLILVFVVGIIAGLLNTLAGGGSFLTLPLLIFLGLPPSVANGTNRVGIFLLSAVAAKSFYKKGIGDARLALQLSIPAILGAVIGANVALSVDEGLFKKIVALTLLLVSGITLIRPKTPAKIFSVPHTPLKPLAKILLYLIFFILGIYGGFIQAGVAFFMILALSSLTSQDLLHVNAIKVTVIMVYTVFALGSFFLAGKIDWASGLILASGNMLGAVLGVRLGISKGERWIRWIVVGAAMACAVNLLVKV